MPDLEMDAPHSRSQWHEATSSAHRAAGSTSSPSSESGPASTSGTSYRLILEHVLSYPGTYELPLRHMYSINSSQVSRSASQTTTPATSPTDSQFPNAEQVTAANTQLTTALLAQISQLPSQPASLPPSFITTFVRRCFHPEVQWIDFPQALTALDYLKDLEMRRRKEVAEVRKRLGVHPATAAADLEKLSKPYPGAVEFLQQIERKDSTADSLYSQLYVSLRRWILINEMSLMPFNKYNCVAMLNTLYPPSVTVAPTARLRENVLVEHRDGYFRYFTLVEKKGVQVLEALQRQNKGKDEEIGWPAVHRTLMKYLYLASGTIAECADVPGPSHFPSSAPTGPLPQIPRQLSAKVAAAANENAHRKVDSGVGLDGQPQSSPPPEQPPTMPIALSRSPSLARTLPPKTPATPKRHGFSTLERIARELRFFGKSKPTLEEVYVPPPPPPSKTVAKPREVKESRSLRKMRSAGALTELGSGNGNGNSGNQSSMGDFLGHKKSTFFDKRTMRSDRLAYEERVGIPRSRLGYDRTF